MRLHIQVSNAMFIWEMPLPTIKLIAGEVRPEK